MAVVTAAAVGDSAGVSSRTASDSVWTKIALFRAAEPTLWQAAADGLAPLGGDVAADWAGLFYRFAYNGGSEELVVLFRKEEGRWLVTGLDFPDRM